MIAARWFQLVVVSTLVAAPVIARADTAAIVVAGDPGKKSTVVDAIAPWVEGKGQSVMLDSVPKEEVDKVVDCFISDDTACAQPVVAAAGVGRFVFVMIEVGAADDVTLTGWLFSGDGLIRAQQRKACEKCKVDPLTKASHELIEALWAAADATRATLKVTSEPPGASVTVDGKLAGATPVDVEVAPGPHDVKLELDGYDPGGTSVQATGGTVVPVAVTLQRPAIIKTKSRLPWFVIGGGGAAIIVSGVLFAIDEDDPAPGPMRPAEYTDTGVPAAVLGAAGVAAVGVGVYLLLRRPHESSSPVARITADGGVVLGWGGSF